MLYVAERVREILALVVVCCFVSGCFDPIQSAPPEPRAFNCKINTLIFSGRGTHSEEIDVPENNWYVSVGTCAGAPQELVEPCIKAVDETFDPPLVPAFVGVESGAILSNRSGYGYPELGNLAIVVPDALAMTIELDQSLLLFIGETRMLSQDFQSQFSGYKNFSGSAKCESVVMALPD